MKHLHTSDSKIVLPVTPLLDMTFQLLFFFIICFNPADQEGHLDLSLAGEKGAAPAIGCGEVIEFPSDVTVTVRSTRHGADGNVSALSVSRGLAQPVIIEGGLEVLRKHLADLRPTLTNKDGVRVQPDGELKTRHLFEVMDACKAAGFANVAMVGAED